MHSRAPRWSVVAVVLVLAVSSVAVFAQARRDFSVTARKYGYTVSDSSTVPRAPATVAKEAANQASVT